MIKSEFVLKYPHGRDRFHKLILGDCDDFTDDDRRENDEYLSYVTSLT